jgi:hypothetical protein
LTVQFTYRADDVLLFLDETGHEEFKGHDVFGLGGIVSYGEDYRAHIVGPWLAIKRRYGLFERALHAADIGNGRLAARGIDVDGLVNDIGEFFQNGVFARFAAFTTPTTVVPPSVSRFGTTLYAAMETALPLIGGILGTSKVGRVAMIFEHSHRHEPLIRECIQGFRIPSEKGITPGVPLAMRKGTRQLDGSGGEPGLEVTDFVMNAVYGYSKAFAKNNSHPGGKDYRAAFHPSNGAPGACRPVATLNLTPTDGPPGTMYIGGPPLLQWPRLGGWISGGYDPDDDE